MNRTPRSRSPLAGGFLLLLGALLGLIFGVGFGEPTIGFLVGVGIGIALAVLIYVVDRGR